VAKQGPSTGALLVTLAMLAAWAVFLLSRPIRHVFELQGDTLTVTEYRWLGAPLFPKVSWVPASPRPISKTETADWFGVPSVTTVPGSARTLGPPTFAAHHTHARTHNAHGEEDDGSSARGCVGWGLGAGGAALGCWRVGGTSWAG
jgi:hypothetical protein